MLAEQNVQKKNICRNYAGRSQWVSHMVSGAVKRSMKPLDILRGEKNTYCPFNQTVLVWSQTCSSDNLVLMVSVNSKVKGPFSNGTGRIQTWNASDPGVCKVSAAIPQCRKSDSHFSPVKSPWTSETLWRECFTLHGNSAGKSRKLSFVTAEAING